MDATTACCTRSGSDSCDNSLFRSKSRFHVPKQSVKTAKKDGLFQSGKVHLFVYCKYALYLLRYAASTMISVTMPSAS